jgi:hypothetical protein
MVGGDGADLAIFILSVRPIFVGVFLGEIILEEVRKPAKLFN